MKAINYIDVEKEFFLIDSEDLADVKTGFYGYSIQDSGIYEEENFTETAAEGLDGRGAYVYVEKRNGKITIRQDYNGSYGIYLFQKEGYFALSNSFFRLLEHVKYKQPLSVDYDYSNHLLVEHLASLSYSETPVKEIRVLDKDLVLEIDEKAASLRFIPLEYGDDSLSLDSEEGVKTLDRWYQKWITVVRRLKSCTDQINVDLSGGFDSRITFLLLVKSGIDLNEIRVRSIQDDKHTHREDYEIASAIADFYGFKLNNLELSERKLNFSLDDIINLITHTKLGFHKEFYFHRFKFIDKRYTFRGLGGEAMRSHWDEPAREFMENEAKKSSRYSKALAKSMHDSMVKILGSGYEAIGKKFDIEDENSSRYPIYTYRYSRCRSHFGKTMVADSFANYYELTPLLDPDLRRVRINTEECADNNLLMAFIYMRYCPELLNFPFEGGRSIAPETVRYAKELSDKYPFCEPDLCETGNEENCGKFHVIVTDEEAEKQVANGKNNPLVSQNEPDDYLKRIFDSGWLEKTFESCFDEEIYQYARNAGKGKNYYPMRECYGIIGLAKAAEDVLFSRQIPQAGDANLLDHFVSGYNSEVYDYSEIIHHFKDDITARIDIKLAGKQAKLEMVAVSDARAEVTKPDWFQKDGVGYVVESAKGFLDLKLTAGTAGKLDIKLKGRNVIGEDGKRVPHWIDYCQVSYNEAMELTEAKSAWHDQPIRIVHSVQAGEQVVLHLEWSVGREHFAELERIKAEKALPKEKMSQSEKMSQTEKVTQNETMAQKEAVPQKEERPQEKKEEGSVGSRLRRLLTGKQ